MQISRLWRRGVAAACLTVLPLGAAMAVSPEDEEEEELEFDEAFIFFELNNTDGDLGIHSKVDGGPWKYITIEDPQERRMLKVRTNGRLRQQGLTELFFESAEPTFDELDPAVFFKRFPAGIYEVEGLGTDGSELESETELTHLIPAQPEPTLNGIPYVQDCDDEDSIPQFSADEDIVIGWAAVPLSHPVLGITNAPIEVVNYEVVVEIDDTPFMVSAILPADASSFVVPEEILALGDEIKYELLVREASWNQTAVESCFLVAGEDDDEDDGDDDD